MTRPSAGSQQHSRTDQPKLSSGSLDMLSNIALVLIFATATNAFSSPPGAHCYILEDHDCKCDMSKQECDAAGGTWTESCVNPCMNLDGEGCYNKAGDNQCDCSIHEEDCAPEGTWTAACSWCAGPIPDGPEGCYDVHEHQCDCDMSEEDCKPPMVWTDGCASCEGNTGMQAPNQAPGYRRALN